MKHCEIKLIKIKPSIFSLDLLYCFVFHADTYTGDWNFFLVSKYMYNYSERLFLITNSKHRNPIQTHNKIVCIDYQFAILVQHKQHPALQNVLTTHGRFKARAMSCTQYYFIFKKKKKKEIGESEKYFQKINPFINLRNRDKKKKNN